MTNKIEKVVTSGWFLTGAVTVVLCIWFEFIKNNYGLFMGESITGLSNFINRSTEYYGYLGAARVSAYYASCITIVYGVVVLLIKAVLYYKRSKETV